MTIDELLEALGVEPTDENKGHVETLLSAETAGLKTHQDKLRRERDEAREQLIEVEGLNLEEISDALGVNELELDELPDLIRTAKAGEKDPKQDARVTELEGKLERADKRSREASEKAEQREAALKAQLTRSAVEGWVTDAVAEQDGNITLLKPHLVGRIKAEVDESGEVFMTVLAVNGEPMEDRFGNPAGIKALVDEFANNETFAAAFEASGIGGSGAGESKTTRTNNNPWAKDTLNLTRQAEIRAENPALAERLKAEAG